MPDLAAIQQAGWHEAERRGAMLRALAAGRCRRNDAAAAAAALGLSTRQVYALVRRLRASGGLLTALVPRKPSGGRGRTSLAATVEAIVGSVIEEVWLNRQQRSIADTALEVRRRCLAAGLKAPAPSTIYRRVVALDPEATVRRGRGYEAARVFAPVGPSALVASRPLAVVQMDHTPVDLVIVDERHRRPIGRPYLTVAIDVYSGCVVGFCLTLDPPSSVSVGLCLTHAVLPKEAWLAERGVEASWPVLGLPAVLHVDNAPEFHGEALQRGCLQHEIKLDHRPVARPHYGGIVERLIGSLMQLVHQLPGTTFSNPTERGSYPSADKACLTLGELERWVTLAITGLHHRLLHSGIGTPPIIRWREGLARPPALPADPKRFLIDFLPVVRRRLRRQGLVVDAITYDSPALRLLARPGADDRLLIRATHAISAGSMSSMPRSMHIRRSPTVPCRAHRSLCGSTAKPAGPCVPLDARKWMRRPSSPRSSGCERLPPRPLGGARLPAAAKSGCPGRRSGSKHRARHRAPTFPWSSRWSPTRSRNGRDRRHIVGHRRQRRQNCAHPIRPMDRLPAGGAGHRPAARALRVSQATAHAQPADRWTDQQRQVDDRREIPPRPVRCGSWGCQREPARPDRADAGESRRADGHGRAARRDRPDPVQQPELAGREHTLVKALRTSGVRMIVIDELHNMLSAHGRQQHQLLNLLRWLGNELQIPLVCMGTRDAYLALRTDDQLENRFEPLVLPPWSHGPEFSALLASFEQALQLEQPSDLGGPALSAVILLKTDGIIGEVAMLLARAAVHAIRTGSERIDRHVVDACGYQSPSERRRSMERALK